MPGEVNQLTSADPLADQPDGQPTAQEAYQGEGQVEAPATQLEPSSHTSKWKPSIREFIRRNITPRNRANRHEPVPPKPVQTHTRRAVLQAFLGVGAVAFTGKVGRVLQQNPHFTEKAVRSIREGKALGDIQEILESQLGLGNRPIDLMSTDARSKFPTEPWMERVAESMQVLEVKQSKESFPVLIFDATESTQVLPVEKKVVQQSNNVLTTVFFDLGETMNSRHGLVLPGPQFAIPPQKIGEVSRYNQYLMWARAVGQEPNSLYTSRGQRGGVVLTGNGKLLVANPQEFEQQGQVFDDPNRLDRPQAMQEYAFIIDSDDLKGSFQTMETASEGLLKDLLYSSTTSALVTIYKDDGSFHTYVLVCTQRDPQAQEAADNQLHLNPLQLSSLIKQLMDAQGGKRFVIAWPDPSPESASCYTNYAADDQELITQDYLFEGKRPEWMDEIGASKQILRTPGSSEALAAPTTSFPWWLMTSSR